MTRRVVAIRHAKPLSEGYADDSLRPLSDEGKSTQKVMCKHLNDQGIIPDIIITSPYLRAMQTAEIAKETHPAEIIALDALGDPFDPDAIIQQLQNLDDGKTAFLIGHAPTLAEFINQLVGDNVLPEGMSKSSSAIVDFDDKPGFGNGKFFGYFLPPLTI